jgi:hypothetical protein
MKLTRILGALAAAAVLFAGQATSASAHTSHGIQKLRDVTDKYHRLTVAMKHQYGELLDVNGIACIADDMGMGAMGVHYVKGDLVGDGAIVATKPEALLYYPGRDGKLHLSGVEYVVLKADWDKHHKNPPRLYGQAFNFTPAGNRFGLPDFYSLHVWAWKFNPAGKFAMFNPTVNCPS